MCGIAGSIATNNKVNTDILEGLKHRGPDAQNYFSDGDVVLYHTRLAIQDVKEGCQPMYLNESLVIVYNGEIYNHDQLRTRYNLNCSTRSDTETILHLYKKIGISFVDELDGMFAIALYDRLQKQMWLIRDRAGKKPLYYSYKQSTGELFFASELNVIRKTKDVSINHNFFYEYLRMGMFYRTHTPYTDVVELPAGHFLRIDLTSKVHELSIWWNIKKFYLSPRHISEQSALEKADSILHQSVKSRMVSSDLEVGCFLSGGIDSSLVSTVASRYCNNLKTFTVAFQGAYNEAPLARLVAKKIGSHHTEINIDFSDLQSNVEEILINYGEPFRDPSAIPTWYVSREAKKHVTVILNGDGADELFGGYRKYVPFAQYDFFKSSRLVQTIAKSLGEVLPVSHEKKSVYNYLYRLTKLTQKDDIGVFCAAGVDNFEGFTKEAFINQDQALFKHVASDMEARLEGLTNGLTKIMLLDFDIILFSAFLVKMDIGSMAHALEGRSPFLSKDFLEWAPTLPGNLKIKGKTTKYLLRQLSRRYIPAELVNQPKRGFEIPLKSWIDNELREIIFEYLFKKDAFSKNFIQPKFLTNVWERKIIMSDEKRAKILWTVFGMEVWYSKCYLT